MILLFLACGEGSARCTPDGFDTGPAGEINGTCAPEGTLYTDVYSCQGVDGPCPGSDEGASAKVDEDASRLDDADLTWATAQLGSCSCSCCHNNEGVSAYVWSWDFSPVWTDSLDAERLQKLVDGDTPHDNDIRPARNNDFTREGTGIPTTDPERMRAFLERELDRR
jgi:hypothetical protein